MIDAPYVYPFASEVHLRRGRTVLRPVVRLALADPALVLNALVDTGSEHVLADSSIAVAAGLDLTTRSTSRRSDSEAGLSRLVSLR